MDTYPHSTEELVDYIVTKVGVPIPTYDYELRNFMCHIPRNVFIGYFCPSTGTRVDENGNTFVQPPDDIINPDIHDTFRGACIYTINELT